MARALRDTAAASEPANLFAAPQPKSAPIDRAILDAPAADCADGAPPVFRSRRA